MGQKGEYNAHTVRDDELQCIVNYLQTHSIKDTAEHFGFNRKTIYRIRVKSDVHPPRHHGEGFSMAELEHKWHKQDVCDHDFFTIRCSHCQKILGSDSLDFINRTENME